MNLEQYKGVFVFAQQVDKQITPRSIIRDYIDVLNLMLQHPQYNIRTVIQNYKWNEDFEEEIPEIDD